MYSITILIRKTRGDIHDQLSTVYSIMYFLILCVVHQNNTLYVPYKWRFIVTTQFHLRRTSHTQRSAVRDVKSRNILFVHIEAFTASNIVGTQNLDCDDGVQACSSVFLNVCSWILTFQVCAFSRPSGGLHPSRYR